MQAAMQSENAMPAYFRFPIYLPEASPVSLESDIAGDLTD